MSDEGQVNFRSTEAKFSKRYFQIIKMFFLDHFISGVKNVIYISVQRLERLKNAVRKQVISG